MDYTKEDLKVFKHRDIKPEQIDRQLANFEKAINQALLHRRSQKKKSNKL